MPGPNLLYCVALLLLEVLYLSVLLWIGGRVPAGSFDGRPMFIAVVAPYFLWVRFHLDRVASRALDAFRPALSASDAEISRLRYELTTLSARTTRIVTAVAVVLFVANATVRDALLWQYASSLEAGLLALAPVGIFTGAVLAVSIVQAVHQLRMVERLHDMAEIDLFRSKPLHAFSRLTAETGVSLLLIAYFVAVVRPDFASQSRAFQVVLALVVPTAIACFVLPLRSMHRRVDAEKHRRLGVVATRMQTLFDRLHERVDQGDLADADKLNLQIASIVTEREVLSRTPSWPWNPAALTAFVSALVPALLWVIQRILTRLGF